MGVLQRLTIAFCASVISAGVASAQIPTSSPSARFAFELPSDVSNTAEVKRSLDELSREPCDKVAIEKLAKALERAGYRREAAKAYVGFSDSCGGHPNSLRTAVNLLLKLSDYAAATEVATQLIALEPFNDNGFFLRGVARLDGNQPRAAVDDFVTALELFGDKDKISSVGYQRLSRSYEQLGRYCDAMLPIEAWVALNPARNANSQSRAILASLTARGNCPEPIGDEDVFPLSRKNEALTLMGTINGVTGKFIFDTGATFVSLKKSFAERAQVEVDPDSTIQLNTANGIGAGRMGRAKLIQLRSLSAADVLVVVQADGKGVYGDDVDGLLGMSFLSQFNIAMDGTTLRLKRRSSKTN
jgi:aspartyl protease family protein